MSREYAEKRIKEALKQAKGNATKARQIIIAWSGEDARLLQALAQPHLTGIVAHAVDRVIYKQGSGDEPEEIRANPRSLDMAPDTFGKEILKVLQSTDTAKFGQESAAPPARRPKASQSHIDALNKIAGKKKKRDD
jgi:hypothetical protein